MNIKAHWQALYDSMRAALDAAGHTDIPVFHTTSIDTQTGEGASPPFVIYRQDVERSYGTMGGGELEVVRSGWVITAYAVDLEDGLDFIAAIVSAISDNGIGATSDGYTTTAVEIVGVQSLYESDFKVYATHLRILWERSANL